MSQSHYLEVSEKCWSVNHFESLQGHSHSDGELLKLLDVKEMSFVSFVQVINKL